jgi:hypothetical protein
MNHLKQVYYKEIVFLWYKNNSKHNPEAKHGAPSENPPIKPLNVRDNNIPTNSPLMIVPTTLPRSSA